MDQNMKVNELIISQMGTGSCIMQLGIYMKENGLMEKRMAKELISILTDNNILEIGRMIDRMEWVQRHGLMVQIIKDIMKMAKGVDWVS